MATRSSSTSRVKSACAVVVATAAVYAVAGRLALWMAIPPGYATAVWPAAGLALVAALAWRTPAVLGVALGSFVTNAPSSLPAALVIGTGAGLTALIGSTLVRRRVGYPTALASPRDVIGFIVLGGPVACLLSATVGVGTLVVARVIGPSAIGINWWTWWIGDSIGVLVFAPLVLLVVGTPRDVWRRRRLIVGAPLVIGFIAVTVLFVRVSAWERERQRTERVERAAPVAALLTSQLSSYEELPVSIASFFGSSNEVTRDEFAKFCTGALARHPAVLALTWSAFVPRTKRPEVEAQVPLLEHAPDGSMRRAADRDYYVPVVYAEPAARNASVLGFDAASEPARRDVLERAARRHGVATSSIIQLMQVRGDTATRAGVLLVEPVYAPTGALAGYAGAAFQLGAILDAALRDVDRTHMTAQLVAAGDVSRDPGTVTFPIAFGDSRWQLEVRPVVAPGWQPWFVLAGGLCLVGLLGTVALATTGQAHQLVASEARYRSLYEDAADMYVTTDWPGRRIVDCNATLCRRLGYDKSELVGELFSIVYPAACRVTAVEHIAIFEREGALVDVERQLRTKTGELIDVSLILQAITDANGTIVGARAMWRDITRRKQGERDRQFFVQVADLLRSSHAPDEGLANVCSALCTHLRAASCEVVDTADGKQLQVTPVSPRAWDERERMLISLVGERVDVFCKYVQATEQRFKTLVEAVQDYAIFMVDPDGRVKTWNHGAERLKGYSDAEIIGSHLDLFYPPEQAGLANKLLAHAREHGRVESEGWRMRKDGTRFWANIVITAVFDASGRLEGFAKVTRDFSERRRHDDELRKSLREREVLLQEVHHRVKNNLQVISSLINMQLRRLDKGPMRDAFEETQTRVLAMALIHEKLYQSKDYSRVPFADYGRSLAQNVFHATGMATHEIQLDLAIDDVSLSLDRAIPCGLLINELMTNALKHAFRDRSGTLRVALERQDDGALRLTVADDGIGLPAGFEAGRATSLGLQIVNTLARQLDAQLIVERQHGSSFQLTFSEAA